MRYQLWIVKTKLKLSTPEFSNLSITEPRVNYLPSIEHWKFYPRFLKPILVSLGGSKKIRNPLYCARLQVELTSIHTNEETANDFCLQIEGIQSL